MSTQGLSPRKPAVQPYLSPHATVGTAGVTTQGPPKNGIPVAIACVYTYFLFSHASEFVPYSTKLHLVFALGLCGLVAVLATGALLRMALTHQGKWLLAFSFWLFISLPFSMWHGGSVQMFKEMIMKSTVAFFLSGGLLFTVDHVRKMFTWLAFATCSVVFFVLHAGINAGDERLSMSYGSLGNANDLASSLLMGLPFLLFVATRKKNNAVIRLLAVAAIFLLFAVFVKTGSRGGLISCGVLGLLAFKYASGGNKLKIFALGLLLLVLFPLVVSKELLSRYKTILTSKEAATNENVASAEASSGARRQLLKNSVILMVRHPLFGVGMGQFGVQSANLLMEQGQPPLWFTSHNIFALVGAETGFPGLILYCGVIVVCFRSLWRLMKLTRGDPSLVDVYSLAFCLLASLTAFTSTGVFSTQAYTFHLPLLAGLTAALQSTSAARVAGAVAASQSRTPPPPVFVKRRPAPRSVALQT